MVATGPTSKHPIKVAAARSGVPAAVLRTWERRYQAVQPERTETGRRLYSDEEIRRIGLIQQATMAGRGVKDVASLPTSDLEALVLGDRSASTRTTGPSIQRSDVGTSELLRLLSLEGPVTMGAALRRIVLEGRGEGVQSCGPLLQIAASGRFPGHGPAQGGEQSVSAALLTAELLESLRGFLAWAGEGYPVQDDGPVAVVVGLGGAVDAVAAEYAAVLARKNGWSGRSVGTGLVRPDLGELARLTGASVIVLVGLEEMAPGIDLNSPESGLPEWVDVVTVGSEESGLWSKPGLSGEDRVTDEGFVSLLELDRRLEELFLRRHGVTRGRRSLA